MSEPSSSTPGAPAAPGAPIAERYDLADPAQAIAGLRAARAELGGGRVIVIPTDTVYGVAADAFSAQAVARLLATKGRTRQSPPPVLIGDLRVLPALAERVSPQVQALTEAFWPGGLTIIVPAQPSLQWDLGETHGTVALRMPAHDLTLELLRDTGPLACSSANLTGEPAAMTAEQAEEALGDRLRVILDGGPAGGEASTIVDAVEHTRTGAPMHLVRHGAVSPEAISAVIGDALAPVEA